MARTSSFPVYDRLKFGGRLAETLTTWRAEDDLSIDEVMIRLHGMDVPVSRSTVVRWLDIAKAANDGPAAA